MTAIPATVTELLARLEARGVALALKGDKLAVSGDEAALADAALIAELRANKAALVELLRQGGAGRAAPPRLIAPGTQRITPELLNLVKLEQAEIDAIVAGVDGGAANVQDIYPLAPLQEGMLFHHLLDPAGDVYAESYLLGFAARPRLDRFLAALQQVVDRHDILRTGIVWDGLPQPVQVVRRHAALPVEFVALDPAGGDAAEQLQARYHPLRYRLDLARAPLLRCHAAQDPASGRWLLSVLVHHLAIDHTALQLLIEEAQAIEQGRLAQLPAPVPFRDFVAQARLGPGQAAHEAFFRQMLGDVDAPTAPFGLLDVQGDGSAVAEAQRRLDPALARALRQGARAHGMGPASLVHLAWALVLARASGRRAVVFGTVLFGRMQGGAEADRALGLLMNTLPLRIDVDALGVAERLLRTHAQLAQLLRHEHAPLALAQRCSAVPAQAPLFTALLNYRYSEAAAPAAAAGGDDEIEILLGRERTNYPLTLSVDDFGEDFGLTVQSAAPVAPERVCDFMVAALAQLVAALRDAPQRPAAALDVLPPAESAQLQQWNATARPYPAGLGVHRLFEAQARRTPAAIALEADGAQLDYAGLNARANRLARRLAALGVAADRPVAVCAERGTAMVEALLATLKAGGGYLPLDPELPAERLAELLRDSAPAALLVDAAGAAALADVALGGVPRLHLLADAGQWSALAADDLDLPFDDGQLAYVIYTSGSTGKPKGVMNAHRGVVNRLLWMQEAYGLGEHDVVLQKTPFNFDVSVWEFFWPLLAGARLVLARPGGHKDPAYLAGLIEAAGVTTLHFVPSMLQAFLAGDAADRCRSVARIFCSGEALPAALARQCLARLPWAGLHNLYGPTEAAVDVTAWPCRPDDARATVPIGRPIANTRIHILDERLQPVPIGVAGELHIGGVQVARGYLNRPELTAERFIDDPFGAAGDRLYKTGDLARWNADGTIDYLGRNDFQVKIRGLRIELGEIEAALAEIDGVREAVVLAREDGSVAGTPGDLRLVAYCTGDAVDAETLRQQLAQRLPAYMVPAAYVRLEAFPLSPNGKLDRKALPAPDGTAYAQREYEAPQGEAETTLATLWAELLERERIGRHDNFFELGGHSLLAVQLLSRVRKAFGAEVALAELFARPVLSELAAHLGGAAASQEEAIAPADRGGRLPLSLAQQRLWFLARMDEAGAAYHLGGAVRLDGELDVAALQHALQAIVDRHEALRTCFPLVDGQPVQRVLDRFELAIEQADLRGGDDAGSRRELASHFARPFALEQAPPLRVLLLQLSEHEHLLQVAMHHIVSDGWSVGLFLNELSRLYAAGLAGEPDPLPPLPIQYADYAAWQRGWLAGGRFERQQAFWRDTLAGAPTLLELPSDRPRPARQDHAGASLDLRLDTALSRGLKALSQRHGTTLFTTLLASWAAVLGRLAGQDEVVIGSPVAGRNRAEIEPLIGFFVNTLALRIDLAGEPTVAELLQRTQAQVLAAQQHQDLPFDQVVEAVQPLRSLSHTPLFQAMLAWQNTSAGELAMPRLTLTELDTAQTTAQFDLTLSLQESGDGIAGTLNYATALFDAATVQRYLGHWITLLAAMVADAMQPIDRLPLLDAVQRRQLLLDWNDTTVGEATTAAVADRYPAEACLHHLFEAQAARTPDAIAVTFGAQRLRYAELNARANQLAHHLRAQGLGPDRLAAICVERGLEMVVAILAVLKAGGAYVPLDPAYASDRLAATLADSRPVLALVDEVGRAALGADVDLPLIDLQADAGLWAEASIGNPDSTNVTPQHLAYVIYTSGSTGVPKGVMVEHRNVVRLFGATDAWFGFGADDVWTLFHSFGFDFSVWEIWGALLHGGRLVVVPLAMARAPAEFYRLLCDEGVTVLNQTPSAFQQLIAAQGEGGLAHRLRTVVFGGEALELRTLKPWYARPLNRATQLVNMYGITETTVHVTYCPLQPTDTERPGPSPIGVRIPDLRLYVLDGQRQPVPIGVAGELYVGGAGVARGYLNRPELTAERFVDNPFGAAGERLYKTGDLARWRADGTIEYLGRNDFQVKIRGFRIELGEIEARLAALDGVREVVVLAREDVPGDKRLVAYYLGGEAADAETLRRHAVQQLPAYMVPAAYVRLESFPLTPNGKLDRKALPAPDGTAYAQREYEAPQGETETTLAALWAELLKLDRIGRHDNFFELGGHSLLAVQLLSRLRTAFAVELPLAELFARPVLSELAAQLGGAAPAQLGAIVPADRGAPLPLSLAQQRLWFLGRLGDAGAAYHLSGAVRLDGELDAAALRHALQAIVDRHEALRTCFPLVDGQPLQRVLDRFELAIEQADLRGADAAAAQRRLEAHSAAPFALEQAPPLRVLLLQAADRSWLLQVVMHHIVSDGWSVGLFLDELSRLYAAALAGEPDPLPPLAIQYADYAAWQRDWLAGGRYERQQAFWRDNLKDAPTLLELPSDRPRPARQDHAGASLEVRLDAALSLSLKALGRRHGSTLYMTLLASWAAVLGRLAGQDEVVIGSPVAGRNRAEVEPLIGFFVNTLALRIDLGGEPTVAELLQRTREQVLAAQQHQDLPFDQVVEAVQPPRSLAHTPLFQAMLAWQNAPAGELAMPGLQLAALETGQAGAHFDLTLSLQEVDGAIAGTLNYATALFDAATAARYLRHWTVLLAAMAADDGQAVSRLPLLDADQLQQLAGWNDTAADYPHERCIHQLFEAQAARTPLAPAVVLGARSLGYAELNGRANRLARHLRARGVGPDRLVAICAERSIELVVAILAVLKAGGAYVPLDPGYPAQRLRDMLEDAAPALLLTQSHLAATLPQGAAEVFALDADWPLLAGLPDGDLDAAAIGLNPRHLAYVIFTSGSTGRPKGVMIEHRSIVNYAVDIARRFDVAAGEGSLIFTSFSFDLTLTSFYPPLIAGRPVRLCPEGNDLQQWQQALLAGRALSPVKLTPSHLALLQQALPAEGLDGKVAALVLGGEALKGPALAWWRAHAPSTRIYNHYGPTETTVGCVVDAVEDPLPAAAPIGRPIANMRIHILDRHGQPVPVGVVGELHIAGVGVARGYLGRPDLSAERFVADPFAAEAGAAMYRTGDLGRRRADGRIEYLGRNDHQVKLRGFRIELGEIEACLLALPGVREAAVIAREDASGEPRLVAYYAGEAAAEALRQEAARQLPHYMLPAAWVRLDALPLTPNGKLDRKALPAPDGAAFGQRDYAAPQGETEATLAALWAGLLGLDRVGRHDNFFELGGHSLLAVSLVERMRRAGLQADVRALFTAATLAELAAATAPAATAVAVPPNLIPAGAARIEPAMLTLVALDQAAIDAAVAGVDGGAANVQDIYPLAPLQEGMLFHHLLDPAADAYLESHLLAFGSAARLERLLAALQQVVDRHDILRTGIAWDGLPQPVQVVRRRVALPIERVALDPAGGDAAAQLEAGQPRLDVGQAPLLRCRVAEDRAGGRWLLQVLAHHLAVDHTTLALLVEEAQAIEHGELARLPAPVPFRNFVAQARLGVSTAEHEAFFRRMLGDVDEPTAPFGLVDVQGDGRDVAEARRPLPPALAQALRRQARALGTGPAALAHLAWALVLARLTGRATVVFGTVLFGRMQGGAEADRALGLFMNTLPLRVEIDARGAAEGVQAVQALLAELLRHEHAPLALAQRCSALPAQAPLFTALLNYRYSAADDDTADDGGIAFLSARERNNYPLTLAVDDHGEGFSLTAQACAPIAPERLCDFMETALAALAEALAEAPRRPLAALDVLPAAERAQLLDGWNDTAADYPRETCLHRLIEAQAARTPAAIALEHDGRRLSYAELDARSNQLARHLRAHGLPPGAPVALAVERGPEMVVGLLGILKAGGAYLPLDPAYPAERLAYMLADARPARVLAQAATVAALPDAGLPLTRLDADWPEIAGHSAAALPADGEHARQLAYLIYTSGSTGRPKGVMVEHRSLVNFLCAMRAEPGLAADDTLLAVTSLSFDIAALELFLPLLCGARVVIAAREEAADPLRLRALAERCGASAMQATPSTWRMLVEQPWPELPRPLKVLCGGEALPPGLAARLLERVPVLWNLYGPTETTVWSTLRRLSAPRPDIGRPIANTRVHVLDAALRPAPVGVAGELYIGGDGVARGYLGRPELTAERFVDDPFRPGERLYRTGDLVRWQTDGSLDYLGRNDFQVKIRGFRIELGEIEAVLAAADGVREAVVLARADAAGDARLVAYYCGGAADVDHLRRHAAQRLPAHMVPAAYVRLESFPLTPNGKLDRKALPAPDGESFGRRGYAPPQGEAETTLAALWAELLKLDRIGRHDNFFELGGHSLLAVQLLSRVRKAFGAEVALAELFARPVLSELAAHLAGAAPALEEAIAPADRSAPLPLSLAQQRLWFLARMDEAGTAYHLGGAVRLDGELDVAALQHALQAIVDRHEALRTCFPLVDGQPEQRVLDRFELAIERADLRGADEAAAQGRLDAHFAAPFALEQAPPVRVLLLRVGDQAWLLQVAMHHIVSDGWSVGLFLDELSRLYAAGLAGESDPLPPLPIQYADYAAWQRGWLAGGRFERQQAFWRDTLAGAPTLLELPADRPRPALQDHAGASLEVRLDAALSRSLRELSRRHGTTLYMTLLASWAALLGRLAGQDEVVIGSPVAGRNRAEIEPLIGFFVNTLALRIDLAGEPTVAELLRRTRAQVLAAQQHQDLPFDQVVEAVQPPRSLAHAPLFQAMLAWQNAPAGELAMPGLALSEIATERPTAQFDLALSLHEEGDGIAGTLNYATALFDAGTVQRYLGHWTTLLAAMAADAGQAVARLPLLDAVQRRQLLADWNDPAAGIPAIGESTSGGATAGAGLHALFEARAAGAPDAVALVHGDARLSYAELNARANRLARYLRRLGLRPDDRVAFCFERGFDSVVAMLAILKAGGAYVPLDPDYPPERLDRMLQDSAPVAVLTHAPVDAAVQTRLCIAVARLRGEVPLLDLQVDEPRWRHEDATDPAPAGDARSLAYVIYTSGSTGVPKGVMVEHRSVVNQVTALAQRLGLEPGQRMLQFASLSFDASVEEVFATLASGATLVLRSDAWLADAATFWDLCAAQRIAVVDLPTQFWTQLALARRPIPACVRWAIIGGEAVGEAALRAWFDGPGSRPRLLNTYGPTEATVSATALEVAGVGDWRSIGRPSAKVVVRILDALGQLVPVGVAGELHIGGVQLARGYLNRPELTAERFVDDPFGEPGERLYKTGDLARWKADGTIEYLGRNDFQVKIRGFRIELGEIEARLAEIDGIGEVAVLAREDRAGDLRLVAYYNGEAARTEALRGQLAQRLPAYMVPAAYVWLESFPLTPNGKLDRKALPAPHAAAYAERAYEAPQGELETELAGLWAELLQRDRVGRHDDFFALGGHSLLAVQLVARLRARLGIEVALRELFAAPTLQAFAAAIGRSVPDPLPANLATFRREGGERPLFFIHPGLGEIGYVGALLPGIDPAIPVYGLAAIGFLPGEQPLRSVEQMAAAYLAAIRRVQPHGPYRLAGWCAGGTVAWEMAYQLLGVDETVEFLGLIDSPSRAPVDPSVLASVLSRLPDEIPAALRAELDACAAVDDRRGMLRASQAAGFLPAELPIETLERYLAVQYTLKLALKDYVPPPLPLRATLFPASENLQADWEMDGWDALADAVVRIPVGGDHMSMVAPPHAEPLARRICEQLAAAGEGAAVERHAPRIAIQTGRPGGATLHCIPGAGASVTAFFGLAQALPPGLAVHGLQPRGLCGRLVPHHDVPAAARAYLQALRAAEPHGPYHLLGHSFGGWVAYEMARQLVAAGEEVGTLVLLDTEPPGGEAVHRGRLDALVALAELFALLPGAPLGVGRAELAGLAPDAQLARLHAALLASGRLPASTGPETLQRIARVFAVNLNTAYRPDGVYPGVLHLFADGDGAALLDGWRPFALEPRLWRSGGNHLTMLQPPYVDRVAALLARWLAPERAGAGRPLSDAWR